MFGNASQPSKVYEFGAKVAKADLPRAMEILRKSHEYRNKLVELELARRAATDAALAQLSPELAAVEAQLAQAETAVGAALEACAESRKALCSKKPSPEAAAALKEAKANRAIWYAKRKELRAALFASDEWTAKQDEIEQGHRAAWKDARANCGLHCGTYLVVEQARGGDRSGAPPRFARFDGCGRIAVQIQNGGEFRNAIDGSGQAIARYLQVNDETCEKSGHKWRKGCIRIGSEGPGGRIPVWLPFTTHLHRDIPADAQVKWAWLVAKRIASKIKWKLQLVLARPEWERKRCGTGSAAVTLGWSAQEDGVRVASWVGTDGGIGSLILPNEQINRLRKCMDLRSIRDKNFDECKSRLAKMLGNAPEWMREACATISHWRAPGKLASVLHRWRNERWQGDEHAYAMAEAWRKQDAHLWEWQANQMQGIQRFRKTLYRQTAAQLAGQYAECLTPAIDWRSFATDTTEHKPTAAEEYRRLACVSQFMESIGHAFGSGLKKLDPAGIASTCGNCQEERPCECGCPDDESRCLNLLRRGVPEEAMAELFKARATTATLRATQHYAGTAGEH
jgi:hypothetical protein